MVKLTFKQFQNVHDIFIVCYQIHLARLRLKLTGAEGVALQ